MEASSKTLCILGLILILGVTTLKGVKAAGACASPAIELLKLIPCASAAQDSSAVVSSSCCAQIENMGQSARCLCALLLSNIAKSLGVNLEIAITIPKRCNIADRPIGFKCGAYTLP